ncbi:patatin [Egicoccus sp. AB-alg6-2]|uniref:patatin n=1 Tax=Egicoccus sp. AB-alg6-2 TaxID=3242692 RepID=UPI00359E5CD1
MSTLAVRVRQDLLRSAVLTIAAITVVSGLLQLLAPAFVLTLVGGSTTPTTEHFFAIIGMFMAIVGGLVLHAELASDSREVALLWGALQKYGAAIAVALGVGRGLFGALALLVAGFDLVSGGLMTWHWRRTRH